MRVLYFHQYFSTKDAAGGARSYEFSQQLIRRGHEVTVVCGSNQKSTTGLSSPYKFGRREGKVDGIRVIEFKLGYSNHQSLLNRALRFCWFAARSILIVLSEKYDLVFATSTPLTIGIPGSVASFLRRKPFVFEVRDLWPELPKAMGVVKNPVVLWALDRLETFLYRSSIGCIGLAPGIVEGIVRKTGDRSRVKMIPNACDLDVFFPASKQSNLLPSQIPPSDFVAIFAGAHGIANGLDALLDVAQELKRRGLDNIWFLFVGDGKLKPALMQRANLSNLHNCVFVDPVARKDLGAVFSSCDVGLMILADVPAFYYGTSPNKFFDYLSSGLPVLTNYPGWVADLIGKNECGLAVAPRDTEAFADALVGLASDRTRLTSLGKNARALAEAEFNRERLANEFVDFLEQMARESLVDGNNSRQALNDVVPVPNYVDFERLTDSNNPVNPR